MSLYTKLLAFLIAAATAPLLVLGALLLDASEAALRERIHRAQQEAVEAEAEHVAAFVREQVHVLGRTAAHFLLQGASPEELEKAVQLLYRSSTHVAFAALLEADGTPRVPVVFYPDPAHARELETDPLRFDDLRRHPPATAELVARAEVALESALEEGAGAYVLSSPYAVPERGEAAFTVALPVHGPGGELLVYVAELSLGALQARARRKGELGTLVVTDATGLTVVHPEPGQLRAPLQPAAREGVLATTATVPLEGLGWQVLALLDEEAAFAPVRRLRASVALAGGLSLGLLLLLAGLFTRRVQRGLRVVSEGALAFGRGDLAHRIALPPERELAELAGTFNAMGAELEQARAKLLAWNEELELEVRERTRALKEAQASLVQSQKLAAVGQLGAGVAHEINNPLSGVLGFAELLRARLEKAPGHEGERTLALLAKVEENARRCREVSTTLLRFSQRSGGERERLPLRAVVDAALSLSRGQLEQEGVELVLELEEPSPLVSGDEGQLVQVLLHLLTNARAALAKAPLRRLTVGCRTVGDEALLVVEDTGKGMSAEVKARAFEPFFTTKEVWGSLGLGLYASFRVVEDHGGRMEIESEPGRGARVTLALPRG